MSAPVPIPQEASKSPGAAPHLLSLGAGPWAIWRWTALRGAGFPVEQVLSLADPESARWADEVLAAEEEVERAAVAAMEAVKRGGNLSKQERRAAYKEIRRSRMGSPEPTAQFLRAFEQAKARTVEVLRETARDERFREALIWQNRKALQSGIASLLRGTRDSPTQRDRQNCELIASYLQRYCTKNDTIGFFGPVGWAEWRDQKEAITIRPHSPEFVERRVGFEVWCVDLLARTLLDQESHRKWMAPRLDPAIYFAGDAAHFPGGQVVRLKEPESRVLSGCDGLSPASELARDLQSKFPKLFFSEVVVYLILEGLWKRKLILWDVDLPVDARPEKSLRRILAGIADEPFKAHCLERLDDLERARDSVALAGGDSSRLDSAMAALEATFGRLTGHGPARSPLNEHAGRTLVYEDCRRNVEIELGSGMLDPIAPALALVLNSARWLTWRATEMFREALRQCYDELRGNSRAPVEFTRFWARMQPLLFAERDAMARRLQSDFQAKWARVIPNLRGSRVAVESASIEAAAEAEFGTGAGGWGGSRYQSLDLMIGASNVDAIGRGEFEAVIGELHVGVNTVALSLFVEQHPCPEDLFELTDLDLPEPRVVILFPKWLGTVARTKPVLFSSRDYFLQVAPEAHGVDPTRVLRTGSLVIEEGESALQVRCRERNIRLDLSEVFGDIIMGTVANCFRILPPAGHAPRVSIDGLVVHRESWSFDARDLGFVNESAGADRFLGARRWGRANGMPRFVFFRSPLEKKPIYLDFDSPILVDMFAKIVRRVIKADGARGITVAEMLPSPAQTWLPDAEGRTYTSEFRIISVDTTQIGRG